MNALTSDAPAPQQSVYPPLAKTTIVFLIFFAAGPCPRKNRLFFSIPDKIARCSPDRARICAAPLLLKSVRISFVSRDLSPHNKACRRLVVVSFLNGVPVTADFRSPSISFRGPSSRCISQPSFLLTTHNTPHKKKMDAGMTRDTCLFEQKSDISEAMPMMHAHPCPHRWAEGKLAYVPAITPHRKGSEAKRSKLLFIAVQLVLRYAFFC